MFYYYPHGFSYSKIVTLKFSKQMYFNKLQCFKNSNPILSFCCRVLCYIRMYLLCKSLLWTLAFYYYIISFFILFSVYGLDFSLP